MQSRTHSSHLLSWIFRRPWKTAAENLSCERFPKAIKEEINAIRKCVWPGEDGIPWLRKDLDANGFKNGPDTTCETCILRYLAVFKENTNFFPGTFVGSRRRRRCLSIARLHLAWSHPPLPSLPPLPVFVLSLGGVKKLFDTLEIGHFVGERVDLAGLAYLQPEILVEGVEVVLQLRGRCERFCRRMQGFGMGLTRNRLTTR